MVSGLIRNNLHTLEECQSRTKPTPSINGKSWQSTVKTNVRVSKESMELLRDAVLARVVKDAHPSPGAGGSMLDNKHHISEIISELVEINRGNFEEQASAVRGGNVPPGVE